jgi:hypothetical protein
MEPTLPGDCHERPKTGLLELAPDRYEQDTEGDYQPSLQMLQTARKVPLFQARSSLPRPLSEATEILDTDFESEYEGEEFLNSPRRSVGSVSNLPYECDRRELRLTK